MSDSVKREIEVFKRKMLADRLAKCTGRQATFFNRIFPKGVPSSKLESAIDLCDRTIAKNDKENRLTEVKRIPPFGLGKDTSND